MPAASQSVRSSGLQLAIVLAGFIAICTGLGGAQCGSNFRSLAARLPGRGSSNADGRLRRGLLLTSKRDRRDERQRAHFRRLFAALRTRASRRSDRRRNGSRGHASELFRCRAHGKNDDMARRREDGRLRPSEPCGLITELYALETASLDRVVLREYLQWLHSVLLDELPGR